MAAATIALGIGLIVLGRLGVIATDSMFEWETRLTCPVMLAAMLFRLDLYAGAMSHRAHTQGSASARASHTM